MNSAPPLPDQYPGIICLPANGTTVTAEALRNDLVCAAELGSETVIDGSAVQTVGQAVLQLLVAARTAAIAAGKSVVIINASDGLRARADACCLGEAIGLEAGKAQAL
jgi:anti-anti-sigma regulatory factor